MIAACCGCSAEIRSGARFCWRCGLALPGPTTETIEFRPARTPGEPQRPIATSRASDRGGPLPVHAMQREAESALPPLFKRPAAATRPAAEPETTLAEVPGGAAPDVSSRSSAAKRDEGPPAAGPQAAVQLAFLRAPTARGGDDVAGDAPAVPSRDPAQVDEWPTARRDKEPGTDSGAGASAKAGLRRDTGVLPRYARSAWIAASLAAMVLGAVAWGWHASRSDSLEDSAASSVRVSAPGTDTMATLASIAPADAAGQGTLAGAAAVGGVTTTAPESIRAPAANTDGPAKASSSRAGPSGSDTKRRRPAVATATGAPPASPPASEPASPARDLAAAASPAAEPVAPVALDTRCGGLTGLRLQQCQACDGLGPFRKHDCELRVQTSFCRGQWGSGPDCQRDPASERGAGG